MPEKHCDPTLFFGINDLIFCHHQVEGVLGAIGGILGVYLGISFFAIYEVFDVLLRGCCNSREELEQEQEESVMIDGHPVRVISRVGTRRRYRKPFPYQYKPRD